MTTPAFPLAAVRSRQSFLAQPSSQQQSEPWNARNHVILLPAGKTEEYKDDQCPKRKQKIAPLPLCQAASPLPRSNWYLPQRLNQERGPRHQPNQHQPPEENDRHRVIVRGIALIEIAQKMLIDEIEPEKASRLALRRIAEPRQEVPRRGDHQENCKA